MVDENIQGKVFSHKPIGELLAIVKNDFKDFDSKGLIDEGTLVKTVMWCNDRLGIPIREVRQIGLPVEDYKAKLPLDFEKLYYVCALECTSGISATLRNPFDNNFDADIIYEAKVDKGNFGGVDNYHITINRNTNTTVHNFGTWVELEVNAPETFFHINCPNRRKKGRYAVDIKDGEILTPFRSGTLYLMYIGMMKDSEGNITFPFHPMITPWYEWTIKNKIVIDAVFNSDMNREEAEYFRKLTELEQSKAWLDAFNFTTEPAFGEHAQKAKKRELSWYNQYFKPFN